MPPTRFIVPKSAQPARLDRLLREQFPDWGRSAINQAIRSRQVAVNGKTVWLNSWKVQAGDEITLKVAPQAKTPPPQRFDPAWLLQDDGDIIAINKPAGLRSMATRWNKEGNLLDLARDYFGEVTLFHRLDRDTSGVCLLTRGGEINLYLDAAFKQRTVQKTYYAWVAKPNQLEDSGTIDFPLEPDPSQRDKMTAVRRGGQQAITHYQLVGEAEAAQRIRLMPVTGRTHQLRVHMQALGAPILGDRLYSQTADAYDRLYLHAYEIVLPAASAFAQRRYTAPITWRTPFIAD